MPGFCSDCGQRCYQKADDGKFYCDRCWAGWTQASEREKRDWVARPSPNAGAALQEEDVRAGSSAKARLAAAEQKQSEDARFSTYQGLKEDAMSRLAGAESLEPGPPQVPAPAVFWGICDLKYDPRQPERDRLKVLELGDGRASRFSHDGAVIKERFLERYCSDPLPLKRQVMVDNKKFTHDMFVQAALTHLRPKQMHYPRRYDPGLAARIVGDLNAATSGAVVLKVVNRARGAGVVICPVAELDDTLQRLLVPPLRKDFENSIQQGLLSVLEMESKQDDLAEHQWHFLSNECSLFVVEELCHSVPVELPSSTAVATVSEGEEVGFDGTMRVAFVFRRCLEDTDVDTLHLDWLGGYWKLPPAAATSAPRSIKDFHSSLVSSFNTVEKRTAPVARDHLLEVYATLLPALPLVFAAANVGLRDLTFMYPEDPNFRAFVLTRYACVLRQNGDFPRSSYVLEQAKRLVKMPQSGSVTDGWPERSVLSYIDRTAGTNWALRGDWRKAAALFQEALARFSMNATATYLRGVALQEEGRFAEAIDDHLRAVVLDPDFRSPLMALGECFVRLGSFEQAIKVCQLCLHRQPDAPIAQFNLGLACSGQVQEGHLQSEKAESLCAKGCAALEAARAGLPDRWTEAEEQVLRSLYGDITPESLPPERFKFWRHYGWRP